MTTKKYLLGTDADANLGLLILRLFLGAALLTHGWGKMVGGLGDFIASVGKMGLPFPLVLGFLSAFAESGGDRKSVV